MEGWSGLDNDVEQATSCKQVTSDECETDIATT